MMLLTEMTFHDAGNWDDILLEAFLHTGPWFDIKEIYQYRKSHCRDDLQYGISYNGKMTTWYWISPLVGLIAKLQLPDTLWFTNIAAWLPIVKVLKQWEICTSAGKLNFTQDTDVLRSNETDIILLLCLTHWGLVMPYGNIDLGHLWLR